MANTDGVITLSRALTNDEFYYLVAFGLNKRMWRKRPLVQLMVDAGELKDPFRKEAGLPLGMDGCFFVGCEGEERDEFDASVFNKEAPPRGTPGPWCSWIPDKDNKAQLILSGKKPQHAGKWAKFLVTKLLTKYWNITAQGVVVHTEHTGGLINTSLTIINGDKVFNTGEHKNGNSPASQFNR